MAKATSQKAAEKPTPKAGQSVKVGDKEYVYVIAVFNVPGVGERTALEASTDTQTHESLGGKTINEWLVDVKSAVLQEK